jgi:hypothetical protein
MRTSVPTSFLRRLERCESLATQLRIDRLDLAIQGAQAENVRDRLDRLSRELPPPPPARRRRVHSELT